MIDFDHAMSSMPLIAVLRGIRPSEVISVGRTLYDAGFRLIEVPLNSPEPLVSIERLAQEFGSDAMIGAGTVTSEGDARAVLAAGGRLIVMPHADPQVIRAAKAGGGAVAAGIATPTEAFSALAAGADALKVFPAEMISPAAVAAMRAVLPRATRLLPVGGITPAAMAPYHAVGAAGFGLGSALFKPGLENADIAQRARAFISAWNALSGQRVSAV